MSTPAPPSACATCNSPLRPEIDRRLLRGDATRKVSAWLEKQHGVDIGFNALAKHKRNHLDVLGEARERVAQQDEQRQKVAANAQITAQVREEAVERAVEVEEVREDAVERIIADVALLDELASYNRKIVKGLAAKMADPAQKKSVAEVMLYNGASQTVRGCVKDRHDITHGPEQNVTGELTLRVDTSPVLDDPESN